MTAVFADTFYFLALLNPSDSAHVRASAFGKNLRHRPPVVTTAFVLTELADALCEARTRSRFTRFLGFLRAQSAVRIAPPTEDLFQAGLNLYAQRNDKDWSLTDCISFEVMRQSGISEALTADKHFEQAGFVLLLK